MSVNTCGFLVEAMTVTCPAPFSYLGPQIINHEGIYLHIVVYECFVGIALKTSTSVILLAKKDLGFMTKYNFHPQHP